MQKQVKAKQSQFCRSAAAKKSNKQQIPEESGVKKRFKFGGRMVVPVIEINFDRKFWVWLVSLKCACVGVQTRLDFLLFQ